MLSLGRVSRLDVLLEALDVGMPDDAVVYVEAGVAPSVRAALAALPQVPEDDRRSDLQGTLWPRPTCFHVLVRAGVLRVLRQLAERHAEPEVCDHIAVYRREEILALAHDAPGGYLLVGVTVPAADVERMRAVLARDAEQR